MYEEGKPPQVVIVLCEGGEFSPINLPLTMEEAKADLELQLPKMSGLPEELVGLIRGGMNE